MSPSPRGVLGLLMLMVLSVASGVGQTTTQFSVKYGNPPVTRYYAVTVPPSNVQVANPAMILSLHGTRYQSSPPTSHDYGWIYTCKQKGNGCIVVTPASTYDPVWKYYLWNASFFDGGTFSKPKPPQTAYPDDVGFLRQLITTLIPKYKINPKKVFVVGFSSGAFMANRVAVELSDLVAAASINSGTLDSQLGIKGIPPPLKPISIMEFHGTADNDNVGVNPCTKSWLWNYTTLNKATVDDTFNYWSKQNACSKKVTTKALCSGFTNNDATSCAAGTEVKFVWEVGNAHTYLTSNNKTVWTWFLAHSKP